ncbi:hypothetical protein N0V82_006426 [Gnomoniopsis sp. IMI 355080]|nr:hypothetical protein N0V82_006426 [Gnomoniopsis sp. IMI 355080]
MATSALTSTWASENRDVKARVNYLPVDGKMIYTEEDLPKPKHFGDWLPSSRYMTFHNARGMEKVFQLDVNGFEFYRLPDKERDFSSDEWLKAEFYSEMEQILLKVTGASHIFTLGHVLRRTENKFFLEALDTERYNRFSTVWPHSDWEVLLEPDQLGKKVSEQEMIKSLFESGKFGDRVDEAKKAAESASRWAVVQIWTPLKTVERDPLALCDGLTVDHSEWRLRKSANSYPVLTHGNKEETHKWYYLDRMQPSEMYIFKGCDSKHARDLKWRGYAGPHAAFALPDSEDKPPRESLEARFICFWD